MSFVFVMGSKNNFDRMLRKSLAYIFKKGSERRRKAFPYVNGVALRDVPCELTNQERVLSKIYAADRVLSHPFKRYRDRAMEYRFALECLTKGFQKLVDSNIPVKFQRDCLGFIGKRVNILKYRLENERLGNERDVSRALILSFRLRDLVRLEDINIDELEKGLIKRLKKPLVDGLLR